MSFRRLSKVDRSPYRSSSVLTLPSFQRSPLRAGRLPCSGRSQRTVLRPLLRSGEARADSWIRPGSSASDGGCPSVRRSSGSDVRCPGSSPATGSVLCSGSRSRYGCACIRRCSSASAGLRRSADDGRSSATSSLRCASACAGSLLRSSGSSVRRPSLCASPFHGSSTIRHRVHAVVCTIPPNPLLHRK